MSPNYSDIPSYKISTGPSLDGPSEVSHLDIKKFVVPALIVALVIGVIIGFFWFRIPKQFSGVVPQSQSAPASLTGWKRYKNISYSFEFLYPPEWTPRGEIGDRIVDLSEPGLTGILILPPNQNNDGVAINKFRITIIPKDPNSEESFDAWMEKTKKNQFYAIASEKRRVIDGQSGIMLEATYAYPTAQKSTINHYFVPMPDEKHYLTMFLEYEGEARTSTYARDLSKIFNSFAFSVGFSTK